jgi:hypothetical protein
MFGEESVVMHKDVLLPAIPAQGHKVFFGPNKQGSYLEEEITNPFAAWFREDDNLLYLGLTERNYQTGDEGYSEDEDLDYWINFMQSYGFQVVNSAKYPWDQN